MNWNRFDEKILEWYMRFTLVFGFAFTIVTMIFTLIGMFFLVAIPISILALIGWGIWI